MIILECSFESPGPARSRFRSFEIQKKDDQSGREISRESARALEFPPSPPLTVTALVPELANFRERRNSTWGDHQKLSSG